MFSTLEMHILEILSDDARIAADKIAVMTGATPEEVQKAIAHLENERVIVKYPAMINWENTDREMVQAVIEVNVQPQRDRGFDAIAARIYRFEEVKSLYLMSGAFDFTVIISGRSIKEISEFVFGRLAPIDGVTSTATHFILKKYKDNHRIFAAQEEQQERLLFI